MEAGVGIVVKPKAGEKNLEISMSGDKGEAKVSQAEIKRLQRRCVVELGQMEQFHFLAGRETVGEDLLVEW